MAITAEPKPERPKRNPKVLWQVLTLILLLVAAAALLWAPEPNQGFATGAAALAFISAAAVGIERGVESFWTLVGRMKNYGDWWPLKEVTDAITEYENETNKVLTEHLVAAGQVLEQAEQAAMQAGAAANEVTQITEELTKLQPRLTRLQREVANAEKLAPGSPRFVLLTGTANEAIETVRIATTLAADHAGPAAASLENAVEQTAEVLDRATDIVSSFNDNPSRRLMSLLLGAIAGVAVAGLMGLNLFSAVLDSTPETGEAANGLRGIAIQQSEDDEGCDGVAGCLDNPVGILLTGIIIGLGASPTHEVIRALQRRKGSAEQTAEVPVVGADVAGVGALLETGGRSRNIFGADVTFIDGPPPRAPRQVGRRSTRTIRMTD